MDKYILNIFLISLFVFAKTDFINAQIEFELDKSYYYELPYDTTIFIDGKEFIYIGGFSGIDKSLKADHYYLVSDAHSGGVNKGDAIIYEIKIDFNSSANPVFTDSKKLEHSMIWGESIRFTKCGDFFISDERTINGKECSQIYKICGSGNFYEIKLPNKYKNEMYDNSGFEGISLSPDESKLYVSLERPMPKSGNRRYTNILEYDLENPESEPIEYYYPLQRTAKGNGITEILSYNDSILFVMERDYVKPDNFVSIYSVNLYNLIVNHKIKRLPKYAKILNPNFIFTFNDVKKIGNKPYKVNNIEGFTFSSDKKFMIFISDNNFGNRSNHTPTQIVCLKIKDINIP